MDIFEINAQDFEGNDKGATIASGPVIVDEQDRFLLHVAPSTGKWQFTGGRQSTLKSPFQVAHDKPKDDLGIEVEIDERAEPFIVVGEILRDGRPVHLTLIHFKASLAPDQKIPDEARWLTLSEIEDLQKQDKISSPNVVLAARHFLS